MNYTNVTMTNNIAVEYCRLKFPNKNVAILFDLPEATFSNIEILAKKLSLDVSDCLTEGDCIFVEFHDIEDAVDFCNSVPDSDPYCVVMQSNEVIHENT